MGPQEGRCEVLVRGYQPNWWGANWITLKCVQKADSVPMPKKFTMLIVGEGLEAAVFTFSVNLGIENIQGKRDKPQRDPQEWVCTASGCFRACCSCLIRLELLCIELAENPPWNPTSIDILEGLRLLVNRNKLGLELLVIGVGDTVLLDQWERKLERSTK